VMTALTPESAIAPAASTVRILACACGDLTKAR